MEFAWILGRDELPVTHLLVEDFISASEMSNLDTLEHTLEFSVPADLGNEKSQHIIEGNFIAYKDRDDAWQMFEIITIEEINAADGLVKSCYCEHVFYELRDDIVEDKRSYQSTAADAIDDALSSSRWTYDDVDPFGIKNNNVYYSSALAGLQDLRDTFTYTDSDGKTAKGNYTFRLEIDSDWTITRYVDFKKQSGAFTGKRFVAGKDINSLKRKVDMTHIVTACYPRGKGEEIPTDSYEDNGDTSVTPTQGKISYGRRLTVGVSKQFPAGLKWIAADSELPNRDFLLGTTNWTLTGGGAGASLDVQSDYTADGGLALQLVNDSIATEMTISSDFVDVTVGNPYSVRCLMMMLGIDATSYVKLRIDWYTGADVFISSTTALQKKLTAGKWMLFDTWSLGEAAITAPATTAKAKMVIVYLDNGFNDLYVDRCRFGHYTTKPPTQEWIENVDSKAIWGRADGTRNIMGIYENDEITDASVLAQLGWQYLLDHSEPLVSYEVDITDLETLEGYEHEAVRLGDLVQVIDDNFYIPIQFATRVVKITEDLLLPENTVIELGNFFQDTSDLNSRQTALEKKVAERSGAWNGGSAFEQLSNSNSRVRLDTGEDDEYQSLLRVEDEEGKSIGYFSSERFSYKEIQSDKFVGQNIITTNTEALTLYVDSDSGDDANDGSVASPFKTLGRLDGVAAIPKILNFPVVVITSGSAAFNEHVEINGLNGGELLELRLHQGFILNGSLTFKTCTAPIWVNGYGHTTSPFTYALFSATQAGKHPLQTYNCMKLRFNDCWANANDLATTHAVYFNSTVGVIDNSVCEKASATGYAAIYADDMSRVHADSCIGSGNYDGNAAYNASYLGLEGTRTQGNTGLAKRVDKSSIIVDDTITYANTGTPATSTASPTTITDPNTQATLTCLCSETKSWQFDYARYRADNTRVYQGRYLSGYPLHAGVMEFDGANKFTALSGKTIKSAKLHIKRLNAGGNSVAQAIHLWGGTFTSIPATFATSYISGHDYGNIATLKWGEELAINLPSQFLTDVSAGTVNSLVLYESDGSPYVVCYSVGEYQIKVVFEYEP